MENSIQLVLYFFIGVCLYKAYNAYSKNKKVKTKHAKLENLLLSLRKIRHHDFQGCEEDVTAWLHAFVCLFYSAVCLKAKEHRLINVKTHVKRVLLVNEVHIFFIFVNDNEIREIKVSFQPDLKWFRRQRELGFEKSWPNAMDGFLKFLKDGKTIQEFLESIK